MTVKWLVFRSFVFYIFDTEMLNNWQNLSAKFCGFSLRFINSAGFPHVLCKINSDGSFANPFHYCCKPSLSRLCSSFPFIVSYTECFNDPIMLAVFRKARWSPLCTPCGPGPRVRCWYWLNSIKSRRQRTDQLLQGEVSSRRRMSPLEWWSPQVWGTLQISE